MLTFRPLTLADYPLAETFKRATFADNLGSILSFDEAFAPPNRSHRQVLEDIQSQNPAFASFALWNGEIIGGVEMGVRSPDFPTEGHMFNIYLKPEWRKKGLGIQLESYIIKQLSQHGCTMARLRTNGDNTPVVRFYQSLGWVNMGVSNHPPIIVMAKTFEFATSQFSPDILLT